MKKLGNVLYVTTPEAYLSLEGETVVVKKEEGKALKLPLHNLEAIVCFNYPGISPALMGACAARGIGLTFLRPSGRFLARVVGPVKGNLLLRKKQYQVAADEAARLPIAVSCVLAKIANSRVVIERALRDHAMLVDTQALLEASTFLKATLPAVRDADSLETLRGLEGSAAKQYFRVFGKLVLKQKEDFPFKERNRRPPRDNLNALLSFLYSLLTYEVASALEGVGLDPQVGFLHADRPGRPSLALDLMEELRPMLADRLALTLINRRQIKGSGFTRKESGGVLMDDDTRKKVITAWQERKREPIMHPFLKERIPIGLIPHVQAQLLARHLRGDLDAYPPFFWS
ncbi:MAG TPA: type I-C CRISPR-associated endonuclease Cas1 [Chloroflexi bacterium]|nr:type I-C CRISPR-associated endonuclease Cas1 [Chloroflexota bacterium]